MEYKYWDILNVPNKSVEGAKTSAPSSDDNVVNTKATVLSVGGTEPSVTETLKVDTDNIIDKKDDVVTPPDDNVVDVTEFKEVNPDELGDDFNFKDEENKDEQSDEKQTEIIETLKRVETKLDEQNDDRYLTADQLSEILKNCSFTKGESKPITELTEDEVCNVLRTFERYQETYFKNLPMRHEICNRFLFNIPRRVYDTHIAVCECYNNPDVFDPLYWLYLCFTECKREDVAVFIKATENILAENDEEISAGYDDILGSLYEEDDEVDVDEEDEDDVDVNVNIEDVDDA